MASLLERARALISSKRAVLGALAIVPLAAAARTADASAVDQPYLVSTEQVFFHNSTTGDTAYPGALQFQLGNPLVLFSVGTISIDGATYDADAAPTPAGSYLALQWTGVVGPSFFPVNNSTVGMHYDFSIGQSTSGGTVSWTLLNNIGGIALNASGMETTLGGSQEFTGTLTSLVTSPVGPTWSSELDLAWSGFGPSTMTVNVPGAASIELSVEGVPEPASLSLMGLGAVGLLVRRRRRGM